MIDQLRKVLRATGPGHTVEAMHALGFEDGLRAQLDHFVRQGQITRVGKYYWLRTPYTPRSYPKQAPPPPAHPIETALNRVGIQEEQGRIVRRTPRGKP